MVLEAVSVAGFMPATYNTFSQRVETNHKWVSINFVPCYTKTEDAALGRY